MRFRVYCDKRWRWDSPLLRSTDGTKEVDLLNNPLSLPFTKGGLGGYHKLLEVTDNESTWEEISLFGMRD